MKSVKESGTSFSPIDQVEGFVALGMLDDAETISTALLKEGLPASEFERLVLVLIGSMRALVRWTDRVEGSFNRLDQSSQEQVRFAMLHFYYAIHDFDKGVAFVSTRPISCKDLQFSIEILVRCGRREEAGRMVQRHLSRFADDPDFGEIDYTLLYQ